MSETTHFEVGDVVTANGKFSGTVVEVVGRQISVENRDGEVEMFDSDDLKHTA